MIPLADRLIDGRSGLRSQIVSYVVAGVCQGLVLASVVPALRALFADDLRRAGGWAAFAAVGAVATAVVTWRANNTGYSVGVERLGGGLMHRVGQHVVDLPLGWFTSRSVGVLSTVMSSSIQSVLNLPSLIIQQLILALTTPATVIVVTVFVDWRLAAAFLVLVPVGWWVYRIVGRVSAQTDAAETAAETALADRVVEFAQAQSVLRSSGRTVEGWQSLDGALSDDRAAVVAALRRKARPTTGFTAVVSLGFALVFSVGVLLALDAQIDVAAFTGVLVLAVRFVEPLGAVGAYGSGVAMARSGLESIAGVVDAPVLPEPAQPTSPRDSSVELVEVTFGYAARPVLDGLSLRCPAGSTTALVGPSGSGKTTLTRLVARFWDVEAGSVRVGGVDVRDVGTHQLMSQISSVFQHVYLFDGTILENVRVGTPGATDEEVLAAARAARLDQVVERLDDGWESRVGEGGSRLSGGERQRVSIARAILKDAPIVLLDEATAALDAENEAAVSEALARLAVGKTVIVIAHKLSTVASADQIAVLDGGRIVDLGTHEDLLARQGLYASFWHDRLEAVSWRVTG